MTKILLVTAALICAIGIVVFVVQSQAGEREKRLELAEIELALATNQRQQNETQNLAMLYEQRLAQLYQQSNAIWRNVDAGVTAPGMGNLESGNLQPQIKKYKEMAGEAMRRLYFLQDEQDRLLRQKLEVLGK